MHISTRLILGGSQENTMLSCAGQADNGHEVALVYGPIYGPEGTLLPQVEAHGGIQPIETPNLIRQVNPMRDMRCKRELGRLIREFKPDVVHTHSSKAGILGRAAAWSCRVPAVVHTIHGLPFHPFQSRMRNAVFIASERWAARRCHKIVCVADAMREQALAAGVGTPELYQTIYSGMETDTFLECSEDRDRIRVELGITPEDYLIGTVARLAELKGHDDLLDALGEQMRSDPRLKLLWVGDGYWRERLLGRVDSMGLRDQVITTGRVQPETIPRYMRSMDLLVHPSWREGLPRTVPQALLSGTPVVAHDIDGTREILVDGETGLLVRPGDHDGLRNAILAMRTDPGLSQRTAELGRQRASEMFPAGRMVDELEQLYASLLS